MKMTKTLRMKPPCNEYPLEHYKRITDIHYHCSYPYWNGSNVKPIDRKSVQFVCEFLARLPDDFKYPEIVGDAYGVCGMQWWSKWEPIIIKIDKAGTIKWKTDTAEGVEKMGDDIPKAIMDVLRLVYRIYEI